MLKLVIQRKLYRRILSVPFRKHNYIFAKRHYSSSFYKMSDSEGSTWRGVPITQIYGAHTPWGAPEFPLVKPSSNHTVLYHIHSDGVVCDGPPKPQIGKDVWDQYHVRLPCSSQSLYPVKDESGEVHLKKRWRLIENALSKPIRNCKELTDSILSYNTKFKDKWKFRALHKLFNKYLEEDETKYFFDVTLPEIIKLALDLPKLIQAPLPLLKQHKNHSISLSQQQIASLLANAFFCTFPRRNSKKLDSEFITYPQINFSRLYESSASAYVLEKLKCICHYFRRVCTKVPTGVVTFSRRSVPPQKCPKWETSAKRISTLPVHTDSEIFIEHADGLIQVDFANRFLGGGVLGHGCVQEEIRFIICPELIASMVFSEEMRPNEAIMMIGVEQYSEYSGYGNGFEWSGDYQDRTPYDSSGRRRCAVLAIDAVSYSRNVEMQYDPQRVSRELNKAWVGFSFYTAEQPGACYPGVATGNWGCGVYRGSPCLKSLVQMMACAVAGRPMAYYTFGDRQLRDDIVNVHNMLSRYDVTVGQLYTHIIGYCESARSQTLHAYLKQVLRREVAESVSDMESMDVSISSDVVEIVQAETVAVADLSPDLFSQDNLSEDTQANKVMYCKNTQTVKANNQTNDNVADGSKMAESVSKMADPKLAGIVSQDGDNKHLRTDKQNKDNRSNVSKKFSNTDNSNTSRLFEEMDKLDESSGMLNINTTNTSLFDVSPANNSHADNEEKIQMDLSSETKKKLSGKITDYFSKKRT